MALNSPLDLTAALEQLRSHDLLTLFTQTLGWEKANPDPRYQETLKQGYQLPYYPLAYRDGVTVWQVFLTEQTPFTSQLRQQTYTDIAAHSTPTYNPEQDEPTHTPLVIFVDAAKTRSLWCQSLQESALYVAGQPTALWKFRLHRFAQSPQGLFPSQTMEERDTHYAAFENLIEHLSKNITGIGNTADCKAYALLTLQRLICIQSIQQRGWLAEDTWYLQTRFGVALQQGKDLFFKNYLQPLYKSLALPTIERPLALESHVGKVPFLGPLFEDHRLEKQYGDIAIGDQPFEAILGWLSEQTNTASLNPWLSDSLGYLLERHQAQTNQRTPSAQNFKLSTVKASSTSKLGRLLSQQSLDNLLLDRLSHRVTPKQQSGKNSSNGHTAHTLNDLFFNANTKFCRRLIQEILPELRILDPACGSGNYLVTIHQRLTEIFSILTGYIQQNQDTQLKIWRSGLQENQGNTKYPDETTQPNLIQPLQKRILKNNLYGIDISASSAETTRLQLLLHVIATARTEKDIEPLPNLAFNVMAGNSLVGFITVDEERFDQVNTAGEGSILQGNLLQPLAADGYQTILAEKNLALEHYKSRNQMLAKARSIPEYARAALLREEITKLDTKAQHKLDNLLLSHMSQQLGIQYKASQLTERPQREPLTLENIDVLQPFHWGYHFYNIIKQGGFDLVVCAPPCGAFKPTVESFLQTFQDLATAKGLKAGTFKTSKPALSKGDPDVAQAWLFYQDQYAYVADYFYRSEEYTHQNPINNGKLVRNQLALERLFIERCSNLLADDGIGVAVLPTKLSQDPKAQTLLNFIQTKAKYSETLWSSTSGSSTSEKRVDAVLFTWQHQ
ncbi:MAG: DNA methyltransferase [Cyanobacteria bacterium P01_F01_bin.53]